MNQERDIGRVGVAVSDEARRCFRFVDRSLKGISTVERIRKLRNRLSVNSTAASPSCKANKARMSYVPVRIEKQKVTGGDSKL
jgi:hypothetical protein